jgi:hypothetical protein
MGTVQALELCRGATRVTEKLAPGGATTRAQDAAVVHNTSVDAPSGARGIFGTARA